MIFTKLKKAIKCLSTSLYRKGLRYNVGAAIEHQSLLSKLSVNTIFDIGANKGQFALVSRYCFPNAKIVSFEPLKTPYETCLKLFLSDEKFKIHQVAIGPINKIELMHVSNKIDSSSLLPISPLQNKIYPGTNEASTITVNVATLDSFYSADDIATPALLKLDVQGFELEALKGAEKLLPKFKYIYCECSFVELYSGQCRADEVISWLSQRGFRINGVYNPSYDKDGMAVQADILFTK